ncbi:MAG: DUF459 domain-containing protein [Deltaproteobacteria bacterium]|nr:DUF459 domain-containing protein [Deltaproteobacteria bacterium]
MGRIVVALVCLALVSEPGVARAREWRQPVPFPEGAPRALVIGDSNIYGPMGDALQDELVARGYAVWRRGLPSTGLGRQDHYDWIRQARAMIAVFQPRLVVVQLGGNDVVVVTYRDRAARPVRFVDEARWRPAYEARARELYELLAADGRQVFVLSPPNRGRGATRVARVRDVQRAAAAGIPGLTYIDMFPLTSDADGRWLYATEDAHGRRVVVRRSDTIHLNDAGGAIVGGRVVAMMTHLGLGAR